jgi:hypothetical protein
MVRCALPANFNSAALGVNRQSLLDQAPSIFPLQPMLLPVLVKFFSRFGQNERSLFSFLYSSESNAIRAFAEQHDIGDGFFGMHQFYDYVRSSIGSRLHTRALSSRWSQIESVIDASLGGNIEEVAMLKTVGVLNMLDDLKLTAQEDALRGALERTCVPKFDFSATLDKLRSKKRVLYYRGTAGGYCLWPYTSVNLELKYAEAEKLVRKDANAVEAVAELLQHRPIVARRHYVETGNLRYFDLIYVKANELEAAVTHWNSESSDGAVFVPLCQSGPERSRAIQSVEKLRLKGRPEILIAVPQPLSDFAGLVAEVRRWEWIATNVPELEGDKHGREEVSRQIDAAKAVLIERINQVVDEGTERLAQAIGAWQCFPPTVEVHRLL